jgi:hypothetical protein
MKLKGIKPIEQHADKVVMGLVAVAGLGMLAYQFFTPSTVKVGPHSVAPADAFRPVETEARELEARLGASGLTADLSAPDGFSGQALAIGLAANPGPAQRATLTFGPAPRITAIADAGAVAAAMFQLPQVPAVASPLAHSFRSTISPVEVLRNPELAASGLIPAQQPFDKASVSIEGIFDGTAFKQQLLADPDGEGPLEPVPLNWWRDTLSNTSDFIEIVAVEVERETLMNADGTLPSQPERTTVPGLPGRPNARKMWEESVRAVGDVPPLIEQIRYMSEDVVRPAYFPTIAGPEWKPPSEAIVAGDGVGRARQIETLRRRYNDINTQIETLQRQLETAPTTDPRMDQRDRQPPPQTGGRPGLGGGPQQRQPAVREEPRANRGVLTNQLRTRERERDRVVRQLEELGERVEQQATDTTAAATPAPILSMLDNPEVRLHAHDFTAEPGARYRYRLRAVINNPLFGRNLQPQQQALGERRLLEGEWSEWSAPVEVDRDEFFFVTSAEGASDINPQPRAVAEMYVFYYGYYRVASASLDPGDVLGGEIRLPELKVADMGLLEQMIADPSGMPPPSAPVAPAAPQTPGRGFPGDPGLERRGAAPTTPAQPVAVGPDWLSVPVERARRVTVPAVFMDANTLPVMATGLAGETRQRYQVVLREENGQIVVRFPDLDRGSDVYKRLEASARAGETQGAPRIRPEDTRPTLPLQPRERPGTTPTPGKGGGGGGGG